MDNQELFNVRLKRVNDAIALQEPDKMPIAVHTGTLPYHIDKEGTTNRACWYDHEAAGQAQLRYHQEFRPDIQMLQFHSGRANEIAGTKIIDWPGKPGTPVADTSSHQVIEHEFMTEDEYPEFIHDYTGFMLRKYLPRAFPSLAGLSSLSLNPAEFLCTSDISGIYSSDVLEAYKELGNIASEEQKTTDITNKYMGILASMGFPPYFTGMAEVPFDIISDYFRGTLGMFEDQLNCPELVLEACGMLVGRQLEALQYMRFAPLPVKRVFIPMHKGMDGFISPAQYDKLYWAPFQRLLEGIIALGAVPIIYTEGPYHTRVRVIKENLEKLPKGSCILHFERGDFVELKKEFNGIACLSGGMPVNELAFGNRNTVIDITKSLIDNVAPGGGYLFNTSAVVDNAKRENVEAMFETAHNYGA
jgi:hypothetical protein